MYWSMQWEGELGEEGWREVKRSGGREGWLEGAWAVGGEREVGGE